MKKITLLLFLMITSIGFSQTNPIDFEPSGNGASWTWNVFESDTPPLEFVANPNTTGNTSATVAKITVKQGGAVYAGTNTTGQGTFDLSEANSTVRIWVYKPVISDIGIKFEQGAASTGEIKVANTKINEWEEIIFDMSPKIGEPESTGITGLVVFPDFDARTQDNIIYFDNITFSAKSTLPSVDPPSVSAPAPTIAEADVLSMYSDSYSTNQVANFNLNAFQGGGTISEVDIESNGNKTIKIEGLTYYGAQWDAVDISSTTTYTSINLDYYATTSTAFNFYLIDATAAIPGGNAAEPKYVVAASGGDETIVQGEWRTISIPLEHFTNYDSGTFSYDLNDIIQWKFDGNGTLFIDNIYFNNTAVAASSPSISAPSPTIAEADVLSMYSDSYSTNQVANFNLNAFQGGGTISEVDIESNGNKTIKIEGLTYYGAQWDPVDVSLTTPYRFVNLDYFATTSTAFNFYLIDGSAGIPGGNAAEPKYAVATSGGDETIVQGEWKTISIPLEHFTNYDSGTFSYDLNDIIQWKFDGNGTLFIDNIYFSVASSLSTSSYELQNISLYPNPAQNALFISAERTIQKASIYNLLGKVVQTILIDNKSKSIDISSLSSGMYIIKYTINSKEGFTKFIKE